ncbi:outer membrane lipoprotein carrier protein LolA [bacterium]|nr:outer membrane lipoprotein carrier protein LolA [bacterium]
MANMRRERDESRRAFALRACRALSIITLCLAAFSASAGEASANTSGQIGPDVEAVLQRLQKTMSSLTSLESGFVQRKSLAILDQELVLKGNLFVKRPAQLAWHVKTPLRYSMIIKDNVLYQWDEDTKKTTKSPLSKNPPMQKAVEQMKQWLSGEYLLLSREYEVSVIKSCPVVLKFVPRKSSVISKVIKSIEISFRPDEKYIQEIRIQEKCGDSTRLIFSDTRLNEKIDASVWEIPPRAP